MSSVFWQLIRRDLYLFRFDYLKAILNSMIWLFCVVVVSNYIMSAMGIRTGYGIFILIGSIASVSLFRCIHSMPVLLNDVGHDGPISYYLSLPIKQYMIFVRYAISFALKAAIITLSVIFLTKLCMWQVFDFTNLSLLKYLIIFFITHIFIGFFTLFLTAYTPDMSYFENIWARIIFPMWFLGCYQFDWMTLYQQIPLFAYINLLNPLTYIIEANRVVFLGQAGYLNFWLCCVMLILFTFVAAYLGIYKFIKRLDCI